ncbi:MAG: nucleotidyltransferase family protein [Pseudomonadota bacterium]
MSVLPRDLVVFALRHPERLPALSLADWSRLVSQARRADLLARVACLLDDRGLTADVPAAPRAHLEAARRLSQAQQGEVRREVAHIVAALATLKLRPILLKGAAYVMAGLPAAAGRIFADVDILIQKARLPEAEASLMLHGWVTTHHSAYDQRYYRQWMHELPPLQHMHRHAVLDVHHTILPETARLRPDAARLIAAAHTLPANPELQVLAPTDLVLHSMTHLFHNEELSHGLRDLSDLDLLLRHFGADTAFWPQLVARARELDLARPLHYGLRHVHRVLGTPVPQETLASAAHAAPGALLSRLMDRLWSRALRTPHPSAADIGTAPALFALYVRAHWLRMPPGLLVRHLAIKATRWGAESSASRA